MKARKKDGDKMTREWLVKIREEKGLSQAAVAKQSGIVQQSYQQIESGKYGPKIENAKRIAAALGFPWTRFFEEDGKSDDVDGFDGGTDGTV